MNTAVMKGAVRAGLVAGIAVWFLALVGIIERLADLSIIGGSLTMDQILIFLPAALAGWVAVRPRVISGALVYSARSNENFSVSPLAPLTRRKA